LDAHYQQLVARFTAEFDALDGLITKAFEPKLNQQLVELSIALAVAAGVPERDILRNRGDLDRYMNC
jgi:hypothetical protein